jgi:hypothetical protein
MSTIKMGMRGAVSRSTKADRGSTGNMKRKIARGTIAARAN